MPPGDLTVSTPTLGLLRGLVVANAALFFLAMVTAIAYGLLTSTPEQETLGMSNPQVGASDILGCLFLAIFVPVHLAGLVGLLLLRNWGRWLNLGTLAVSNGLYLITSVFEVSAVWGFPTAVWRVEAIVSGLILGLVFYSPLARQFTAVDAPLIN